jgi:hypothetical protein
LVKRDTKANFEWRVYTCQRNMCLKRGIQVVSGRRMEVVDFLREGDEDVVVGGCEDGKGDEGGSYDSGVVVEEKDGGKRRRLV